MKVSLGSNSLCLIIPPVNTCNALTPIGEITSRIVCFG